MLFVCMETLQGSFNPLQPSETWSHSEPSSSPATALLQILVGAPGFLLPGGICSLQSPLPNSTDVFHDQRAPESFSHHLWFPPTTVFLAAIFSLNFLKRRDFCSDWVQEPKQLFWLHKHNWKCANLTSKMYVWLSAKKSNKVSLKTPTNIQRQSPTAADG